MAYMLLIAEPVRFRAEFPVSDRRDAYERMREFAADMREGRLSPGDRLPPQRKLADRLNVDFTTVARGYVEAQKRGLIESRVGQGTFVRTPEKARPSARPSDPRRVEIVDRLVGGPPQLGAGNLQRDVGARRLQVDQALQDDRLLQVAVRTQRAAVIQRPGADDHRHAGVDRYLRRARQRRHEPGCGRQP